jgi:hypothetical protein
MAKRTEVFSDESLNGLFLHHPYLFIFQKEDWKEYFILFAQIYNLLEEENVRVPFEAVRTLVLKYYSQRKFANIEQKLQSFFNMAIGELEVLRDSHDQFGQRFVETTRSGKQLLQIVEGLLERRTRFTGTGAETLLGALNDILSSRKQMTEDDAIAHHREKIKSYQNDIKRIQQFGVDSAELLPIPHSNEALFNQAETAAEQIISAIEDVKSAIERQRQELAQAYFEGSRSAGQSVSAMAEFYERLYSSAEYMSYKQAKALLSHIEGFASRFGLRDIDRILAKIREKELIHGDELAKSSLPGFMFAFQNADHGIQEKIKGQIRLLQQQVHYALSTDILGLQSSLHGVLSLMLANKAETESCFVRHPFEVEIPVDLDAGSIELSEFQISPEVAGSALTDSAFDAEEMRSLFLALAQAEETTLQAILQSFRDWLGKTADRDILEYRFVHGLAEYYVLSEIELFDASIKKEEMGLVDIEISTKHGAVVVRNAKRFRFSHLKGNDGVH